MAPEHPLASLRSRLRTDPGQPLLVWHQQSSGARVELSSASTWNYICKAANLMCEEFEVGPESQVDLRLPAHWQSICWVLAAWALGARVSQGGAGGDPDAIVLTPAATGAGDVTGGIVTSLDAWGGPCATALPAGFLDAGRELRMQPDTPMWVEHRLATTDTAALLASGPLTFADLTEAAQVGPARISAVVGMRMCASGAVSHDPQPAKISDRVDAVHADNSQIVTASALAAIAAVCRAGSIVVVDGDAEFTRHIAAAESVGEWVE